MLSVIRCNYLKELFETLPAKVWSYIVVGPEEVISYESKVLFYGIDVFIKGTPESTLTSATALNYIEHTALYKPEPPFTKIQTCWHCELEGPVTRI